MVANAVALAVDGLLSGSLDHVEQRPDLEPEYSETLTQLFLGLTGADAQQVAATRQEVLAARGRRMAAVVVLEATQPSSMA